MFRTLTESPVLERLHNVLEAEIRVVQESINETSEQYEAAIDDGYELIENLLGMSFVSAQVFITSVQSEINAISKLCISRYGNELPIAQKQSLFKLGPSLGARTAHSAIEVVDGVANYWKHGDQWETEKGGSIWTTNRHNLRTVEIVNSIGLLPSSTGNLRKAARMLDVTSYDDLTPVRAVTCSWAKKAYEATKKQVLNSIKH